jgi:hypothetical protein
MPAFQPDGYPSASPYLVVKGAAATIEFMQRARRRARARRRRHDVGDRNAGAGSARCTMRSRKQADQAQAACTLE